jgi:hypothetical protein
MPDRLSMAADPLYGASNQAAGIQKFSYRIGKQSCNLNVGTAQQSQVNILI